ncbi:hypothetical protein JCM11641_005537 [Rhodosporidiobolus odoratus]
MSSLDTSFQAEAASLERAFLDTLLSGGATRRLEARCVALFDRAHQAATHGRLAPVTIEIIRGIAKRISVVSSDLCKLDANCRTAQDEVTRQSRVVCERLFPGAAIYASASPCPSLCSPPALSTTLDSDDPTQFLPYRNWFLENLVNPYPSSTDKSHLLNLVPSHKKEQLDTWFTNNRRRSGWQALKRAYTDGSKGDLERLLQEYEEGALEESVAKKVRAVKTFFADGGRDRVAEGIKEILQEGKPVQATKRKIETKMTRGVLSPSGFAGSPHGGPSSFSARHRAAPYSVPSSTPSRHRRSTSGLTASPTASSLDLSAGPRYPSTFSPPASSAASRTLSDSSSSSTDSLISYASLSQMHPSSPPASSSLLSFDGSLPSSSSSVYPLSTTRQRMRQLQQPQEPHPYFCTLAELPAGQNGLARAFGYDAGVGAMAENGDLLV